MRRILPASGTVKQWLAGRRLPMAVVLIALVLTLPSLWTGLQVDDLLQRLVLLRHPLAAVDHESPIAMFDFADGDPQRAREAMDMGFLPWWTWEKVRLRFCRPAAVLTHWLDYRLWADNLVVMHIHSLAWFGALVFVAALVYRRLIGIGWASGLAALLYAVEDAHSIPAGWLANRNGLLAALFGLWVVLAHDKWRRAKEDKAGRILWLVVGVALLLLAVLSNEGGIAACAYLFAYALFLDKGPWRARAMSLLPYAALIVAWRVGYNALGFGTLGSELYVDPAQSPLRFLQVLCLRAPVLLFAQWAVPLSDLFTFLPPMAQYAYWAVAVAFCLILLAVVWPVLRKDPVARFWGLGMVLSLTPVCATFPMDRLLLFAGVGAMGLLACFIREMATVAADRARPRSRTARSLCVFFIIMHLGIAPVLLPARICQFAAMFGKYRACLENAPLGDDVAERTVVIPNAPNVFLTSYLPAARALAGKSVPMRLRSLAGNTFFPVPIRMTRQDERTLVVKPRGGFPWYLVRDRYHPLPVGHKIELAGTTVEVLAVAEEGWPLEVAYRFDVPLEDPSLLWLELDLEGVAYVPWRPPAVGESVVLNERWF